jgi:signal transduction histidine kinase
MAVVIVLTALTLLVSIRYQLNEAMYALTRHWEWFQADELPIGMLALSIGLIWLAWRRYRHARLELAARRIAEARLAAVLEDNRQLARENLRIQESERKHLARELHDELGQYLNAIKLDAVAIRDSDADPKICPRSAAAIVRAVDHVHSAVSGMIARLRPVGLDELGLKAAIEHCVHHWRERHPDTEVRLTLRGELEGLDEALGLTLYRLIQEALTNVHKHAGARHVQIALERAAAPGSRAAAPGSSGETLCLTVADDGCGMDPSAHSGRFGLRGMRERVQMAGGTFTLDSALGEGTRLCARLPVGSGS